MKYNREKYMELSEEKKLRIIEEEINLETHNGTTKDDLLMLLKSLWDMAVDVEYVAHVKDTENQQPWKESVMNHFTRIE